MARFQKGRANRFFAQKMGEKLGICIHVLTDYNQCDRVPDITVNATSAPVPVMDIAAAHPGGMHVCVGGLDHPDLYKEYTETKNQMKDGKKGYVRITAPKEAT